MGNNNRRLMRGVRIVLDYRFCGFLPNHVFTKFVFSQIWIFQRISANRRRDVECAVMVFLMYLWGGLGCHHPHPPGSNAWLETREIPLKVNWKHEQMRTVFKIWFLFEIRMYVSFFREPMFIIFAELVFSPTQADPTWQRSWSAKMQIGRTVGQFDFGSKSCDWKWPDRKHSETYESRARRNDVWIPKIFSRRQQGYLYWF